MTRPILAMFLAALLTTNHAFADELPCRLPVGDKWPKKRKHVDPHFPEKLRAIHATGIVFLDCVIGYDGRIETVQRLAGPDAFSEVAIAAVRRWAYEPPLLDGRPARVAVTVSVFWFSDQSRLQRLYLEGLADSNDLVRETSARDLGHLRVGVDELVGALQDPSPRVRAAAAQALGNNGRKARKAIPVLTSLGQDPDPRVRDLAAWAIKQAGGK
ncbi:MAG: hypothetical protein E6J47_08815 [Chloroflexi bacterium]|nr:MAG: hypothetical protein E6J47_08815 [Chloroflexota bacterium]